MNNTIKSVILGSICGIAVWALPTTSANAFDCTKAATKTELAICNNPELLEIDGNMEQVFFSMLRRLEKKPGQLLRQGQRNWLIFRESTCEGEPACLIDEDQTRLETLDTINKLLPEMAPVFLWQEGTKNTYTVRLDMMKFAYPDNAGLAAFNKEIDNVISMAPFSKRTEEQGIGAYEYETIVEITQLTSDMVSAMVYNYDYSGGAHPNSFATAINIDLSNGKPLKVEDLFPFGAIERITDDCRDMVVEAMAEMRGEELDKVGRDFDEEIGADFTKQVSNMKAWHFNENGATITFNPYDIASYAEGEFTCEFSSKMLLELSKQPELIRR